MSKKLVIFDLDGTLLDTIGDLAAACNRTLAVHGYPEHPLDRYRLFVGNGMSKLVERALPPEVRTPEYVERIRGEFVPYYQEHIAESTRPYEGIPGLLEELAARGVAVAVASNKYDEGTRRLIAAFFPGVRFAAVLGQRAGVPTKPDPAIVNDILGAAGVAREETLYVGDSGTDMRTARNAGVESAGVTWGFRGREELEAEGADHIVDTPAAIAALV